MRTVPPTFLARLMSERAIRQADLVARVDTLSKQQMNKLYHGKNAMTEKWARILAPHLGIGWAAILDGEAIEKSAPHVEHRVVVGQLSPPNAPVEYETDEEALLAVWRNLSIVKKAALFSYLGLDDMPSLRRKRN